MTGTTATDSPLQPAAAELAAFVAGLKYEDIPEDIRDLARDCLIDAVACAAFGRRFPWSEMVLAEATETGGGGACHLPGVDGSALHLPQAALALGTFAHSFELDSLRKPGAGVHPGATVALPALEAAQERDASGRDLIVAVVAACEVMFRIGAATLHTPEKAGFHAPGLTGPFGAAAACGKIMGLSAEEIAHAFGLAGSFGGGLLAFARSGQGGMVKRLHLGRAAEGGVLAARLAGRGFEGPASVLDGDFGLLDAYCSDTRAELLTAGLGQDWEMQKLCIKSFACHVTAQAPIHGLRNLMEEQGFAGDDIAGLRLSCADKVVSHHGNSRPVDVMGAQYSVPYSLALSAFSDPADPGTFMSFDANPRVADLATRIVLEAHPDKRKGWGAEMTVRLHDGRAFTVDAETFPGCPETPLSADQLRHKFDLLMRGTDRNEAAAIYGLFMKLPEVDRVAAAWREIYA